MAMALPLQEPERFATSDVALVAWLRYNGVEPAELEWRSNGKVCFWLFKPSTEVAKLLAQFQDGKAMPEVREFNRIFGETKQEMFNSRPNH